MIDVPLKDDVSIVIVLCGISILERLLHPQNMNDGRVELQIVLNLNETRVKPLFMKQPEPIETILDPKSNDVKLVKSLKQLLPREIGVSPYIVICVIELHPSNALSPISRDDAEYNLTRDETVVVNNIDGIFVQF